MAGLSGVLEAKFCLHLFLTKQGEGSPSATSNQTPKTKGNPYRGNGIDRMDE